MALIKCSECSREISDKAATCPGCGAPIVLEEQYDSDYDELGNPITPTRKATVPASAPRATGPPATGPYDTGYDELGNPKPLVRTQVAPAKDEADEPSLHTREEEDEPIVDASGEESNPTADVGDEESKPLTEAKEPKAYGVWVGVGLVLIVIAITTVNQKQEQRRLEQAFIEGQEQRKASEEERLAQLLATKTATLLRPRVC